VAATHRAPRRRPAPTGRPRRKPELALNRLTLTARIVEKSALRHTPAGLPAIDVSLRHESDVGLAGLPRKVAFEMRGRALGPVAEALAAAPLGEPRDFEGYLGSHRNGRGILLHIEAWHRAAPAQPN
jgi:primosomal replication protein N